jgi:rhodanese-related sulfurtransferase
MNPSARVPYQCIPASQAATLIRQETGLTIFDVRDLGSYRLGHVENAAQLSEERVAAWVRRLPKEQPVLIYCYHGNASQTYAQMFSDFRFTRVFSVDGGYEKLAAALT